MVDHNIHEDDDVIIENGEEVTEGELELEDEEELSAEKMKKLRDKLRTCEKEKQEHLDGWQRARADFLNYKRRTEEDMKRQGEQGVAKTVELLLPLLDSFALATKGKAWDEADTGFRAGFEMIRAQLDGIMKELGVEILDPTGHPFNPHDHEALSEVAVDDDSKDNTVVETIQPGYRMKDTVIRAARVIVGKAH